jgi:hypothetical protein
MKTFYKIISIAFLFFCVLPTTQGQEVGLFSEDELAKQPMFTNIMLAFQKYDKAYRLTLKGSGGYYGKVDAVHPKIDSLIHLQYFYVVNEALENLPPNFEKLEKMQQLYLSGNKFKMIPPCVLKFKNLKRLDMRGNQLTKVPEDIGNLTELEYLYLNDNTGLDFLPTGAMGKLQKLKFLNLKGTKAPREQVEIIKKALPNTQVEF